MARRLAASYRLIFPFSTWPGRNESLYGYTIVLMLPAQETFDRRRVVALCVVTLLMLCWGKIVTEIWINWNLWAVLLPMCAGIAILAYLSPPVAAAFYFLGNYFFGNLSIAYYPRMSFLTVIAAVLLGTLLVVRWKRGELAKFLTLPKRVWLALAALALFFLLGFTRAVWEVHTLVADPGHSGSVLAALKESLEWRHARQQPVEPLYVSQSLAHFPSDRSAGVSVSGRFKDILLFIFDPVCDTVIGHTFVVLPAVLPENLCGMRIAGTWL